MKRIANLFSHVLITFFILFSSTVIVNAYATTQNNPPVIVPPAPDIDAKGFVLMDAGSGKIIAEKNMDEKMAPASLTKLMTLYIISEALSEGQIKETDEVRISKEAWKTGGSRMFLKVGSHVPVKDLIDGIIIASGNDATVAMAEYIAGTQKSFAQLMNETAKNLGMNNTHYLDPTGLPKPDHYSTPHDIAILTRAIIKQFPQYYSWYKQKWITWNGIKQPNRNRLLWRDPNVDGLKTGHTESAGYCLVSSAKRNNMRLISVVMGAPSDSARANESQALLNWGFRFYKTYQLFPANKSITTRRVWLGQKKYIPFGLEKPLTVTIPAGQYKDLNATMTINPKIKAPINAGQVYGEVKITLSGQTLASGSLIALENDPQGGLWTRFRDRVALFFHGSSKKKKA